MSGSARPRSSVTTLLLGALAAGGCNGPESMPPEPAVERGDPRPEPVSVEPSCPRVPSDVLALAETKAGCPIVMSRIADQLWIGRSDETDPASRVVGSNPCEDAAARCEYAITSTAAGPVGLAVAYGPESAAPTGAWLLLVAGALESIPLWAGPSVRSDYVEQGPMYRLAPRICGETLALVVEARLGGAPTQDPVPELSERAGAWEAVDGTWTRTGPVPAECRRVRLPVP